MKKINGETINHRLAIGERFKCGAVFIKNIDGYTSTCTVECQLCEDRSICNLKEFVEHIEIWHSDWEDELQHDEMQEVADELAISADEVVQPFEKVLIVTETKTTLSLAFSESEEISEISEQCEKETNISYDSDYTESLDDSSGIAYTVNIADILKGKAELNPTPFEQHNEDSCSSNDSAAEHTNFEKLENEAYSPGFFNTKIKQISNTIQNKPNSTSTEDYFNEDEEDHEEEIEEEDEVDEEEEVQIEVKTDNLIDRSEDSGVEKSEISSSSASTPQHKPFEDEANFEPRFLNIKEQVRLALNEPPPKPKLAAAHMEKLIELYESYSHLWRRSHPEYNRPQLCRKSWKEITRKFNRTFHENFSIRDIRVRVSTLCQRYLKERRRREMACEINEPKIGTITSRYKYFDKLKFLDTQQNVPYEEYSSRLAQEHEKLLETYSHFPLLWSNADRHHEGVELREKAYNDICTALQLIGIHIPPKMIRQRLAALRKRYRLEKMRHLHCKLQGKTFETSFKQYEQMKFIDNYIAPFVCGTCGKIFRKSSDYQEHINQSEHKSVENSADLDRVMQKAKYQKESEFLDFTNDFCDSVENFKNQGLLENNTTNFDQNCITTTTLNTIEHSEIFEEVESNVSTAINSNYDDLLSLKTTLRDSLFGKSNTLANFENFSNEDELISMKTTLKDPINDFNNLLEVPIVLQTLDGSEDLRSYFNEDQFFTLTSAFESNPDSLDNHTVSTDLNTIKSSNLHINYDNFIPINAVVKHPTNDLHIQSDNLITLQVLPSGVEISPSMTPFVPVILSGTLNNLVTTQISHESENIEIVAQYLNGEHVYPMQEIVSETTKPSKSTKMTEKLSEDENSKCYSNENQLISMAINFEETDTIFENTNDKNTERYFNQPQFTSTNDIQDNLDCQSTEKSFITLKSSMTDYEMQDVDHAEVTSSCTELETAVNSIKNSEKVETSREIPIHTVKQINKEKTTPTEKLTARIECGNVQVEIDLNTNKESSNNKSEPSLLGRLPREQALELIGRYRDFPQLWHPEHEDYNSRRMRRLAWKALAKDLNKNLNTHFNWLQVQRKILDYVKYYRHERRRVQNKKGCTQWSFYDNFDFLDEVMKPPSDLEKRIQLRTQTLKIIEVYEAQPQMWNTRHSQYTKRHQRQRSIAQMRSRLQNVHKINIEESKLKQRLLELRKEYRTTKLARVAAERRNEIFEPLSHFEFYEPLQFLEAHVPPFNCVECIMEFKCFTDYNIHMKKEHKDYKRVQIAADETNIDNTIENICHICGIKFTLRHNLLQHLKRHYIGRTFPCSVCGKKFYTKNTVTEHERIHSKEPGVICADCGQTFVNTSKLNQHMKRHRNQRDHKCEQCNKLFYTAFDRDRHVRRHLQIRDKICPFCGRAFVMGSSYYAHLKLHSDKKEYVCTVCNKEFAQNAGLYKHRRRYHPI